MATLGGVQGIADKLGLTNKFEATPYQFDESAFSDPFLQDNMDMLGREKEMARGRTTELDTAPQQQFRNAQLGLMGQLQAQAAGQGPSLAEQQLRGAFDRQQNQALAQASTLAGSPELALRNLRNQQAQGAQNLAHQATMARMQEQLNAQQALMGLTGQGRGQDIGLAQAQAQASLQQQALNDAMVRAFTQMGLDQQQAQFMANQRLQELMAQQHMGAQGINAGIAGQNAQTGQQMFGGLMNAAGTAASMFI